VQEAKWVVDFIEIWEEKIEKWNEHFCNKELAEKFSQKDLDFYLDECDNMDRLIFYSWEKYCKKD